MREENQQNWNHSSDVQIMIRQLIIMGNVYFILMILFFQRATVTTILMSVCMIKVWLTEDSVWTLMVNTTVVGYVWIARYKHCFSSAHQGTSLLLGRRIRPRDNKSANHMYCRALAILFNFSA